MTSYRTSMREALKEVWGLEEKFSSAQIAQLKKAFEPMRGKKISMKSSEKLRGILDKVADDKETLLALLKANIPFVSRGAATRLISKHDMKGAEINKLMAEDKKDFKVFSRSSAANIVSQSILSTPAHNPKLPSCIISIILITPLAC